MCHLGPNLMKAPVSIRISAKVSLSGRAFLSRRPVSGTRIFFSTEKKRTAFPA